MPIDQETELAAAVERLERRVAALEGERSPEPARPAPEQEVPEPGTWWLLDALAARPPTERRDGATGRLAYGGRVSAPGTGELVWQLEHPVADVLGLDLGPLSAVLGALGHPLRLELLRRLLLGASTLAELQEIPGTGTSGQLQHHLRELRATGLVTQPRRGHYAVPADRVVPLLTILAAAAGPPGAAPGPAQNA